MVRVYSFYCETCYLITQIEGDGPGYEMPCFCETCGKSLFGHCVSSKVTSTYRGVDPKQACATKKATFDAIPITLKILASVGAQSGADKYGLWNWLKLEDGTMSLKTYLNAVERHLILFNAGQDHTSDTNIHNLDSIIVGLSVVRDAMIFGKVKDDRVKLSPEQIVILEQLINKE